jgi:hypothetical protein
MQEIRQVVSLQLYRSGHLIYVSFSRPGDPKPVVSTSSIRLSYTTFGGIPLEA